MMIDNLTVLIPAKQEKESIKKLLKEILIFDVNIIIVIPKNDYETLKQIKEINYNKLKIIFQKKNGFGNAIIEGIEEISTDFFCLMMGDGSQDPSEIILMYENILKSKYNFIFGSRYMNINSGSDDDTVLTFIGNKFFTYFGKIFFNLNLSDILYTFILGETMKAKSLNLKQKDFSICVELPIKANQKKFLLNSYPAYERKRFGGFKKVKPFRDGYLILKYMVVSLFFIK
jgi:glycosyltransferase involved in cell wall biosynthesis